MKLAKDSAIGYGEYRCPWCGKSALEIKATVALKLESGAISPPVLTDEIMEKAMIHCGGCGKVAPARVFSMTSISLEKVRSVLKQEIDSLSPAGVEIAVEQLFGLVLVPHEDTVVFKSKEGLDKPKEGG